MHPEIGRARARLRRSGASLALMSGSGAAVFGVFDSRAERDRAAAAAGAAVYPISLVSRRRYQRLWQRQLAPHSAGDIWPPRSRYASPAA
jgi:4-diphosphocytidyl-2-C-methyl-D-erythritol kinase